MRQTTERMEKYRSTAMYSAAILMAYAVRLFVNATILLIIFAVIQKVLHLR